MPTEKAMARSLQNGTAVDAVGRLGRAGGRVFVVTLKTNEAYSRTSVSIRTFRFRFGRQGVD
jgi:hypothetical protein